jgi:DNA-binding NtrC family response regulator
MRAAMSETSRILVVDDEESITYIVKTELDDLKEFETDAALSGTEAITLLQAKVYDVVLLDMRMPRVHGIEVLKYIKETSPTTEVIVLTNVVDMKMAVETTKLGAYDFIGKPYDLDQLIYTIHRAIEHRRLLIDRELGLNSKPLTMIGKSRIFRDIVQKTKKVALSESFVLVQGASGTGKELFAKLIHSSSHRSARPFIVVNCAAMPDQLLESELFGHEKGSFTSAVKAKQGLVEVADGGTLFLDEVGDISLMTQPKLLRFLETGEFRRVGGTSTKTVDVRVVSATNKNLQEEVKSGHFREDLLYRLNVVELYLPLLKDRKEDIPLLVENFLMRKSKTKRISDDALEILMKYDWPGNVRELEHVIEGALALCQGESVDPRDLMTNVALSLQQPGHAEGDSLPFVESSDMFSLNELEKKHIEKTLKHFQWNRMKTAKVLGITPKTLYLKIKRYKIRTPKIEDFK